jgi:hypothetical protein
MAEMSGIRCTYAPAAKTLHVASMILIAGCGAYFAATAVPYGGWGRVFVGSVGAILCISLAVDSVRFAIWLCDDKLVRNGLWVRRLLLADIREVELGEDSMRVGTSRWYGISIHGSRKSRMEMIQTLCRRLSERSDIRLHGDAEHLAKWFPDRAQNRS